MFYLIQFTSSNSNLQIIERDQNLCQISFTSHWPHSISGSIYFELDIRFCKSKKEQRRINATKTIYNNRKNLKYS